MNLEHSIAIVVLVYNSFNDAQICVDQLLKLDMGYHIIVVDNCSTDGAYEQLVSQYSGAPSVDLLKTSSNKGYSAGNNFGIRYAMRRYSVDTVAVMNPDVFIPNGSVIRNLVKLLWSHNDVLAVGGQPINHTQNDCIWISSWSLPSDRETVLNHLMIRHSARTDISTEISPGIFKVDCIVGCFFLAKAGLFAEIGLFDENVFLYNEENILGVKCRRAGMSLLVDKNQIYYHNHSKKADREKALSRKLMEQKAGYESRKYFVSTYYSPALVCPLAAVEGINRLILILVHIKNSVLRIRQNL